MKRVKNYLILLAAILLIASVKVDAQINAGISLGHGGGLNSFFMTVGNYFRVPQREIIVVRDRRLPDDEIPVVFFVARRAGVSPREVARLRRSGYSWMDITYQLGLGPEIFFPGRSFHGPRGNAWGYYKHHRGYNSVSDYDIINAVNSRMISECYKCGENDVVRMRNQGRSYGEINDMYYGKNHGNEDQYNYHNQDRWNNNDNGNRDGNSRDDNYGYGDPGNRN